MASDGGLVAVVEAQNAIKKKTLVSRSWILLSSTGEQAILDADKYEIMHRVQIHARDLRILDPLLSYPSTILGREGAIVLNLEVFPPFSISRFFPLFLFRCFLRIYLTFVFLFLMQHIKAIITAEEVCGVL